LADGEQAAASMPIAIRKQPVRMAGYVHAARQKETASPLRTQ
jgi:hypothetical protein